AVTKAREAIKEFTAKANEQARATIRPGTPPPQNLSTLYPEKTRAELQRLRQELDRLTKAAPVVDSAMGVMDGAVADASVLRRGNRLMPGKLVPRRFPSFLAGERQSPLPAKQSGRLELARWMTRKDHPLTARVMVNRIWRWHFGQGLVRSVDNFGRLGE